MCHLRLQDSSLPCERHGYIGRHRRGQRERAVPQGGDHRVRGRTEGHPPPGLNQNRLQIPQPEMCPRAPTTASIPASAERTSGTLRRQPRFSAFLVSVLPWCILPPRSALLTPGNFILGPYRLLDNGYSPMLTRRALALYTTFCLLFGLLSLPQGPSLVCRMTGMSMSPVMVTAPTPHGSCCDVAVVVNGEGEKHYALTSPGCCELRLGVSRTTDPATAPSISEIPVAMLTEIPSVVPLILMTIDNPAPVVAEESSPRAPPIRSASPRAPPQLS
jgi:hypothetical protein